MENFEIDSSAYIQRIYDSNGKSISGWKNLLYDINSEELKISQNIVSKLNKSLVDKNNIDLTFDIIDFIIHFGNEIIISLIAGERFLDNFLYLLAVNANLNEDLQEKLIFLIQKWALKFQNNEKYKIFWEKYNFLKSKNIVFPEQNYVIETYNKYISEEKINEYLIEIKNIIMKNNEIKEQINNYHYTNTLLANPLAKKTKKIIWNKIFKKKIIIF